MTVRLAVATLIALLDACCSGGSSPPKLERFLSARALDRLQRRHPGG